MLHGAVNGAVQWTEGMQEQCSNVSVGVANVNGIVVQVSVIVVVMVCDVTE